ncbi:tRNA (5-methylaminomethyl-2-thiouridine)(34)-methyltransferase MnmD [Shewanella submarina]|uniref:tRNA (5-methylaminomethyl-2-thiouridine)(34)-methyltransferase MnmD n=1 Tax=Shewanella submarina TaxID=2016376 RepID=A0ABV7G980_9GAMM|nr:tRNA (5-methylaminomethyl-2-thiouridine)(34)-methyltransferase MnmD [Shewanella submarina]MCL1038569.1 tRNA (5-methylaminomethyl-2-thiouridine)(34)-methyltransferase MnmD [Shewanella submarina]
MKHVELQLTADGSHTLFNAEINETYHNPKGAIAEARYIFIHAGMDAMLERTNSLSILEVGFGTGLNALLTMLRFREFFKLQHVRIRYVTIEPYPLSREMIESLNYKSLLPEGSAERFFDALHDAPWDTDVEVLPWFVLHKRTGKLEDYQAAENSVNLIYFDAFAPSKQAEVWARDNLQKCHQLLQTDGMLVSYCASGQFKRDLKAVGFSATPYPGALGTREMTRAFKKQKPD